MSKPFTAEIQTFREHIYELASLSEEDILALVQAIGHDEYFKKQFQVLKEKLHTIIYLG